MCVAVAVSVKAGMATVVKLTKITKITKMSMSIVLLLLPPRAVGLFPPVAAADGASASVICTATNTGAAVSSCF
jgi:hypothetical protein